jgi:hypothetical protein
MARLVMSFTLDPQADRHIVRYLEGLPKGTRSQTIRDALDAQMRGSDISLGDVYQAVKELEQRIGSGLPLVDAANKEVDPSQPQDEPADVAANLDRLGL